MIPKDTETKTLYRRNVIVLGVLVIDERWEYDGVEGRSLIYKKDNIGNHTPEGFLGTMNIPYEIYTISYNDGYVFVNYYFKEMKINA